ncbi:MAG: CBASS oligonucleotide cyclase [Minicystis sp.]
MTTVVQAFESMRQGLELTDAQRKTASDQQNVVRDNLKKHLGGISRDFLSGSYARATAIKPLHDIDLFVVLDPTAHRDVYPSNTVPPSACLKKVHRALAAAYPTANTPTLQQRSVNIVFTGTGIGYDVVPAFENRAGMFVIPDRGRDAWIETQPEAHRAALVAANEKAGGKLNALIKMAKHWKKEHRVPLRSFHLEVMAYGAFTSGPDRFPEGVRAVFGHLANAVQSTCPVPGLAGLPSVDAGMMQDERTRLRTKLLETEQKAREALEHERFGRDTEAHRIWRWMFGSAYPVG